MIIDASVKHNVISIVACILEEVTYRQDATIATDPITPFTALCKPNIHIQDYYERIHKYANCSIECLILSLIYIDRLIQSGTIPVNSLTIHRVIITSVMLAIKFFDDAFFNNSFYARIGGIPTEELNSLELEFLKAINFSLLVTNDDYQKYYNELCMHANNGLCPYCLSCPLPPLNECTEGRDRVLRYQSPKSCTPSPRNIAGYYPI